MAGAGVAPPIRTASVSDRPRVAGLSRASGPSLTLWVPLGSSPTPGVLIAPLPPLREERLDAVEDVVFGVDARGNHVLGVGEVLALGESVL